MKEVAFIAAWKTTVAPAPNRAAYTVRTVWRCITWAISRARITCNSASSSRRSNMPVLRNRSPLGLAMASTSALSIR